MKSSVNNLDQNLIPQKHLLYWLLGLFFCLITFALIASAPVLAGTTVYQYDSLGRVIKITYANGSSVTYAYDKLGNRILVGKTQ